MGAERPEVAGLVLAGGRGRRLGGVHKAFVKLCGRPLIAHVVGRLRPQVDMLAISANERREELQAYGRPVLADPQGVEYGGPLAGVLAGLEWLQRVRPACRWLATAAVDMPFLPRDAVDTLLTAARQKEAACAVAENEGRLCPVLAIWSVELAPALRRALQGGQRRAEHFLRQQGAAVVPFRREALFNINRPQDLEEAQLLAGGSG